MAQFKTIGIAPIKPMVKREVDRKFEKAKVLPTWPETKRVRERRRSGWAGIIEEELKDVIPNENEYIPTKGEWWKYHKKILRALRNSCVRDN